MSRLPKQNENPQGLYQRYYIQKVVPLNQYKFMGSALHDDNAYELNPVDENAEYFVMRLDDGGKDKKHIEACRKAVCFYANEIKNHLPGLSKDLFHRYGEFQDKYFINTLRLAFANYCDEDPIYTKGGNGQIIHDIFEWFLPHIQSETETASLRKELEAKIEYARNKAEEATRDYLEERAKSEKLVEALVTIVGWDHENDIFENPEKIAAEAIAEYEGKGGDYEGN